jgi:hypothetical protein
MVKKITNAIEGRQKQQYGYFFGLNGVVENNG